MTGFPFSSLSATNGSVKTYKADATGTYGPSDADRESSRVIQGLAYGIAASSVIWLLIGAVASRLV